MEEEEAVSAQAIPSVIEQGCSLTDLLVFSGGGRGGGACYNCGEEGHQSRDCPEPKSGGGGGGGGRACFNCGETGHISRECPNEKKEGGGGGGGPPRGGDRPAPTYEDGRYVTAYAAEQSTFLSGDGAAVKGAGEGAALDDYAKMVEFSRTRRENLKASGQERRSGGRGGRNGKGKQSAPRAFGTNDHGPGMKPDDDLKNGERVDEEGMVYSVDGGTRTVYFCDRFRRYKFDGDAGGLALLQAMCTKNDVNLALNGKLFSGE